MKIYDLKHSSFLRRREIGICQERKIDEYIKTLSESRGTRNGCMARDNVSCHQ